MALAVAAVLVLDLEKDGGPHRSRPTPIAAGAPALPGDAAAKPAPDPIVPSQPVPEVPLAGADSVRVSLKKRPRAGLLFDVRSGRVLWRDRPLRVVPMASLTKIMTAVLVTERDGPRTPVRITSAALRYQGSGVGMLPRGRRVRLEALLNGLLLVSGNDAAIALADHVSGNERRFVALMNRRAAVARAPLHPLRVLAWPRGGQPLLRARPRGAHTRGHEAQADPAHRAPLAGVVQVPDQGRPPLPERPQPADPRGLSGRRSG